MRRFNLIVQKFSSRINATIVKELNLTILMFFFWIDIFSNFRFDDNIFHFYNSAVKILRIQKNHDVFIIFHLDCALYHLIDAVENFLKRIESNSTINDDLIWRKSIDWIIRIKIEFLIINRTHNCWMKNLMFLLLAKEKFLSYKCLAKI